ncbi:hypothetical protein [Pyrodictium abyssi]|uniref:Uncharacterized protein n=1 Tax=Pyrodictium abyssi TaxID=54256 RepID=A0ABN6ZTH6_9CREN|nr:hypothetical protein PABY_05050 [Pyrodictium abyssi]
MAAWRCSCPICRLLVWPLVRRAGGEAGPGPSPEPGAEEASEPAGEEAGPEVEAQEEAVGVTAAVPSVDEVAEKVAENVVDAVRSAVQESARSVLERLSGVEGKLDKLHDEVKGLVSSVEAVVLELREALSEASNPLAGPAGTAGNGGLQAAIRALGEIVERSGAGVVEEIVREYVRAGVLSEEEARRITAIARAVERARERGLEPRVALALAALGERRG